MSGILDDLNPEQLAAVKCTEGPELIIAGAGSGKTRVLTSRIAYLISLGVPPERILALTFTKKAAGEMKERIAAMVGDRQARRIWMGTFHSVFIRFLREYAEVIEFPATFTIYDQTDSVNAVKTVIKQLNLDEKTTYKPREIQSRISKAKNDLITPTPYANGEGGYRESDRLHKKPEIYRIYSEYCKFCKTSGVMDFDDILLYTNVLFRKSEDALANIAGRFTHILVDEYQDTNLAQYLILKKLASVHHNLCVVGDDSQSIYAFRGAQIQNILNFQKDFPETRLFRLERNYRSTANIVNAANSLIANNEGRIPKNCVSMGSAGEKLRLMRAYTESEEAFQIASAIISRMQSDGASYDDFAILYRTNAQSRALEEQLRRRNIPYIIFSGNSFFERAEVKDLMAYFKLAVNLRDDESFKRIVNKPARGISENTVKELTDFAFGRGLCLFEAALSPELETSGLRGPAIKHLREFCTMMQGFAADSGDAYKAAMSIAHESGLYLFYKSDESVEGQSRFQNIQELLDSVAGYVEEQHEEYRNGLVEEGEVEDASEVPESALPVVTLGEFLENISLLSSVDVADDETSNKVALMTAHSAKGLEFPYVFVAGMEENLFPGGGWTISPKELEEERRLFYVAITRAKKAVVLTYADTRMRNGRHENNQPSRFLREIAPQYVENPLAKAPRDDFGGGLIHENGAIYGRTSGFGSFIHENGQNRGRTVGQAPVSRPAPTAASAWEIKSAIQSRPKPAEVDPDFVPDPMSSFREGDRIEHNRFGKGTMGPITGTIPDLRAEVTFDLYGKKILLLRHAKLRHIK
ncbi:MAG: UvrD-helicase domain-containing protein [Bacteroidales bacterium]|nr:UvrD-helicase domain-containing protein [Bacteroidales bacterium]